MYAVTIHDTHQEEGWQGILSVDLSNILRLYEGDVLACSWQCRDYWCIPPSGDECRDDSQLGQRMSGAEFMEWTGRWQQVIDGEFVGTQEGDSRPWLIILARDSSYYVVVAAQPDRLAPVKAHYRDVRDSDHWSARYS